MSSPDLPPPGGFQPSAQPGAAPTAHSRHRPGSRTWGTRLRRMRRHWYMVVGGIAVVAVAGSSVSVNGDITALDTSLDQLTTTTPVAGAPSVSPATTVTAATTTTVVSTTTRPPSTTTIRPASTPAVEPPPDLPSLASVIDDSGQLRVSMPASFVTNVQGVTLNGVEFQHVSGASDIDRYLAGDFSVFGATVLAGPTDQAGTPSDLLVQFDPGGPCTLTDGDIDLRTTRGAATVLSYDQCGGENAMVLLAVEIADLDQTVFVGVQGPGDSAGAMRDLVFAILESVRPV